MQRIINYIMIATLLAACKKDNSGPTPAPAQHVRGISDYGEALLVWDKPDASVLYVQVDYRDTANVAHSRKFSVYADTAVIANLEARAYDFTVRTFSEQGKGSAPETITVTPKQAAYRVVAGAITAQPTFGAVQFSWRNETGKEVGVNVTYKDNNGQTQIKSVNTSAPADSLVIDNLDDSQRTFTVTVSNAAGAASSPQEFKLQAYREVKISKAGWTATADTEEPAEGPPNGLASAAIDDNINTFWHSQWADAEPGYPHWLKVDMKKAVVVSRVELVNRQNNKNGFTRFRLEYSLDDASWTSAGEYDFKQQNAAQSFSLANPPQARYIRIVALTGVDFYAFLAELTVYGQP